MRLIDADVLLEQMRRRRDYVGRASDAVCLVEDAPTIEAEPIRRGEWVKAQPNYPYAKESRKSFCSLCGNWGRKSFKYCQHCGAKMEVEE